jgi:hypothetical protein
VATRTPQYRYCIYNHYLDNINLTTRIPRHAVRALNLTEHNALCRQIQRQYQYDQNRLDPTATPTSHSNHDNLEQWLHELQVTFRQHLNAALPEDPAVAQRLFHRTYMRFRVDYHSDSITRTLMADGYTQEHANRIAQRLLNFHQTVQAFDTNTPP